MSPRFSVVIATRNRAPLLAQTLDALAGQRWPADRFEILVADNGSTDGTRNVVEQAAAQGAPLIRYFRVETPGKSRAVNAALDLTRGDLIAFTDDDVTAEPEWLERLAAAFHETDADYVTGRILPRWESPPPPWLSAALFGVLAIPDNGDRRLTLGPSEDGSHVMPIGANMAVRASVLRRIGGLRQDLGKLSGTLRTGEDHELFLRLVRAGCRGVYEPSARVRHFVPRERLERHYFRRWLYQNGRDVAGLDRVYAPLVRRLFGVPRYLWKRAATDAAGTVAAAVRRDEPRRFNALGRLVWFGGYVRASWWSASR
jgi:glycosyltransferase involved in cell wall biosynthesis